MRLVALVFFLCGLSSLAYADTPSVIERGRYIAVVGGCNDCHTSGFAMSGGKLPESEWLKGDPVGWRGPWGTTYPANLRLRLSELTEDQWVVYAKNLQARPPMPSYALHTMSDQDLRALYQFVLSLGRAGETMPSYVPPGQEPKTPFYAFVPQQPAIQ